MDRINNFLENQYRELQDCISKEFVELYQCFNNDKLQLILSTIHAELIYSFKTMNNRLPTGNTEAHFWAEPSRKLINAINHAETLQKRLSTSEYAFRMDSYYKDIIEKCNTFLEKNGGSTLPAHMKQIELYFTLPIFCKIDSITIKKNGTQQTYNLKLIGEGSYAKVYAYKDDFYNRNFVLKRAKSGLNDKELKRFKQEYDQMSKLASPYVVEVYKYNETKKEYIMEYMDSTLCDYIEKNNSKLDFSYRKSIGLQILKAFSYIHSKELLHRDISPNNVLIKKYDDVIVVKISDFGLVRVPQSDLTSLQTEIKGCFNDPNLQIEGFNKYNMFHEIYALTRLLYFVMTGKTNLNNEKNTQLKEFLQKGTSSITEKRYKSLEELTKAFRDI